MPEGDTSSPAHGISHPHRPPEVVRAQVVSTKVSQLLSLIQRVPPHTVSRVLQFSKKRDPNPILETPPRSCRQQQAIGKAVAISQPGWVVRPDRILTPQTPPRWCLQCTEKGCPSRRAPLTTAENLEVFNEVVGCRMGILFPARVWRPEIRRMDGSGRNHGGIVCCPWFLRVKNGWRKMLQRSNVET